MTDNQERSPELGSVPQVSGDATASTLAGSDRRRQAILGLKILLGLLVIAAPVLIASQFVTGVTGVAFYGVLAAAFGWIAGGPRTGLAIVTDLALLGATAILLADHTWLLATLLLALGVLYGSVASRGYGSAVVQLPILTPYFMMDPPGLFTDPAVIGPGYIVGVVGVMLLTGLWTLLVLHLAMPSHTPKPKPTPEPRVSILYGTILGVLSALVMLIATSTELKMHWVWVTLTLYVLADPLNLFTRSKTLGRFGGTMAGFVVVTLLAVAGIPDSVLQILALPALWVCLFFMVTKRPYWQYTLFLTVTVVLINSYGVNTLLLDAERFAFTIVGALLSLLAAFLVNLLHFHRRGLGVKFR